MLLPSEPILIYETKTVVPGLVKKSINKHYSSYASFARDLKALSISYKWHCESCELCIAGKKSIDFEIDYLMLLHAGIALPGELYTLNPKKVYTVLHDLYVFGQRVQALITPVERAIYKPLLKLCESFEPYGKEKIKIGQLVRKN